jgi:hypothetical protein
VNYLKQKQKKRWNRYTLYYIVAASGITPKTPHLGGLQFNLIPDGMEGLLRGTRNCEDPDEIGRRSNLMENQKNWFNKTTLHIEIPVRCTLDNHLNIFPQISWCSTFFTSSLKKFLKSERNGCNLWLSGCLLRNNRD